MNPKLSLALAASLVVAGCMAVPPKEPEKISIQPITYVLPKENNLSGAGLAALKFDSFLKVVKRDSPTELHSRKATVSGDTIVLTNQSFLTDRKGKFDEPGVDYRKYDEVGVEYTVRCAATESETEVRSTCTLAGRNVLDNTSFGVGDRFDARHFSLEDLTRYLKSSVSIDYTFEVDSQFNSESTLANFHRLLKESPSEQDGRDRITGKIFKATYLLQHMGREVRLLVQVYPYKNGSKAVVTMRVPGIASDPNTIDFSSAIRAVKERVRDIVNS